MTRPRYTAWFLLAEGGEWTSTGISCSDEPMAKWAWENFKKSNHHQHGGKYHAVKFIPEGQVP